MSHLLFPSLSESPGSSNNQSGSATQTTLKQSRSVNDLKGLVRRVRQLLEPYPGALRWSKELEVAFRLGLKTVMGLPLYTSSSITYAATELFDQRHVRGYSSLFRLLVLLKTDTFVRKLCKWCPDDDWLCFLRLKCSLVTVVIIPWTSF